MENELIERLEYEYRRFEIEMMNCSKIRIYERCGEIQSKIYLLDKLTEVARKQELTKENLVFLLEKENILDFMYLKYIKNGHSFEKILNELREVS